MERLWEERLAKTILMQKKAEVLSLRKKEACSYILRARQKQDI